MLFLTGIYFCFQGELLKSDGPKDLILNCMYCQYFSYSKENFLEHVNSHKKNSLFYCLYCKFTTYWIKNLIEHARSHKTEYNKAEFTDFEGIKVNKQKYTAVSAKAIALNKGKNRTVSKTKTTKRKARYKCQYCSAIFTYKSGLHRHLEVHLNIKKIKCPLCYYKCRQYGAMRSHIKKHKNCNSKLLWCTNCNFQTKNAIHMLYHSKRHSDKNSINVMIQRPKKFNCLICYRGFSIEGSLNMHMSIEHGENSKNITEPEEEKVHNSPKTKIISYKIHKRSKIKKYHNQKKEKNKTHFTGKKQKLPRAEETTKKEKDDSSIPLGTDTTHLNIGPDNTKNAKCSIGSIQLSPLATRPAQLTCDDKLPTLVNSQSEFMNQTLGDKLSEQHSSANFNQLKKVVQEMTNSLNAQDSTKHKDVNLRITNEKIINKDYGESVDTCEFHLNGEKVQTFVVNSESSEIIYPHTKIAKKDIPSISEQNQDCSSKCTISSNVKKTDNKKSTNSSNDFSRLFTDTENQCNYACGYCTFYTNRLHKFNLHLAIHKEKDLFECSFCPETFSGMLCLKNHLNKHAEEVI